jgi:hypothetical protein
MQRPQVQIALYLCLCLCDDLDERKRIVSAMSLFLSTRRWSGTQEQSGAI